jgi:NTE family protein
VQQRLAGRRRGARVVLGLGRSAARDLLHGQRRHPPDAPPAIFAVVAASASPSVERFWNVLHAELTAATPTVAVTGGDVASEREDDISALVDRLEESGERVLLLATADSGPEGWPEFCIRQADRVLLVADDALDVTVADGPRCDLVFLGRPSIARIGPWVDRLAPRAHHVVRDGEFDPDVRRVARRIDGRAIGLVLSGGGARGFAHVGAYEVLAREGIEIDRVGGCSMGSLVGALIACGLGPDEVSEACRRELVNRSAPI